MPLPLLEDEDVLMLVSMVKHIREISEKDRSDVLQILSKKMRECLSFAELLEMYLDLPNFFHKIPVSDNVRPMLLQGQITIIAVRLQSSAHDWSYLSAVAFAATGDKKIKAGLLFAPAYERKYKPAPHDFSIEDALSLISGLKAEDSVTRINVMKQLTGISYTCVETSGCWIGCGQSKAVDASEGSAFCTMQSNSSILDSLWVSGENSTQRSGVGKHDDPDDFVMIEPGDASVEADERQLLLLVDEEEEARAVRREEPVLPVDRGILPVVISKVKQIIPRCYHGARLNFVFGCLSAFMDDEKLPSEKVEEVLLQTVSGAVGGSVGQYAGTVFAIPAGEVGARRALLKAGSLASAAVVALVALYDGLQYARGRETRIDIRRNLAANSCGAAGSLLAGAAVAAVAGATTGAATVGWPAVAVAAGASVAGVAGGICGSYAGRVADAAAFDADADAAVHAYEFFGWPAPPRHGPRPEHSAAEVAAVYRRRTAERPGAERWAGRCTGNLLKLLRAMYPEYAAFQSDLRAVAAALRAAGPPPSRFVRATAAYLAATDQPAACTGAPLGPLPLAG
jgi:hypothetical protein